jgi:hypothetical protein
MGFTADKDPASVISSALVIPAEGNAQLVVQYKVDRAAVRSPWAYLGVQLTDATGSQRTLLQPPHMPPAGQPSPLPCSAELMSPGDGAGEFAMKGPAQHANVLTDAPTETRVDPHTCQSSGSYGS